jgi:hypothetical protein
MQVVASIAFVTDIMLLDVFINSLFSDTNYESSFPVYHHMPHPHRVLAEYDCCLVMKRRDMGERVT